MNRKMHRSLLVVSFLVALSMLLTACGGTPAAAPAATAVSAAVATAVPVAGAGKALVGIVLPTKSEPRWLQDEAVFKKAGWEPLFSELDSAKEKANVEALISQGIKVLIITRRMPRRPRPRLKKPAMRGQGHFL